MPDPIHLWIPAPPGYVAILIEPGPPEKTRIQRIVGWSARWITRSQGADADRIWKSFPVAVRRGEGRLRLPSENPDFDWAGHVDDIPGPRAAELDVEVPGWRVQYGRTAP